LTLCSDKYLGNYTQGMIRNVCGSLCKVSIILSSFKQMWDMLIHVSKIPQYQISDSHTPTANSTTFQKGPLYFGITVFNHLPTSIKNTSHDINQFTNVLKSFLLTNSFYSEEYFAWNSNRDLGSV